MKKVIFLCLAMFLLVSVIPQADAAATMSERLKGKILLQVEENGEAWYVNPADNYRHFLGRPADAFQIMRELGLGVSEANYEKFDGYAPSYLAGKILLRVEANGEAYYVNPLDLKLNYLGRPADAFRVMRELGLGITNGNLDKVKIHANSKRPENAGNSLQQMINAVDSCSAYTLSKQSVSDEDTITLTMNVENEIIGDNGDGRCNYRYNISDVSVTLSDAQRQAALAFGQTEDALDQSVIDLQIGYEMIFNGEDTYIRIQKTDLKDVLNRWKDNGYWTLDNDMDTEIYNMWLDGGGMPGVTATVNGFSVSIKSVEGVDGTAVFELNGVEYTMEKDETVVVDGHEFMYTGTQPTTCTINGEDLEGADCGSSHDNDVKYQYRVL